MLRGKLLKHSPPSTAIIPRVSIRRSVAAEQIVGTAPRSGHMPFANQHASIMKNTQIAGFMTWGFMPRLRAMPIIIPRRLKLR
jgi:hypothetical protein